MSENQVVIYSNGVADFQRSYEVQAQSPQRISIPVRQDHLADVLASFNVYGDVKLDAPPTFRPSNELEGNITINPQKVLEDLATNLSGARVRVERANGAIEGTLVGLHHEDEATSGQPIKPKSVIVLANDGLRRCMLREIQSFNFLDEDVQAEIDKALQRNYQRIKPNSTFVELVLSTTAENTDAVVQYTIPAAAWKISYRLRIAEDGPVELQGFAIVDNNTDEDWTDFHVSVVTGEPITFSTDLADSKVPARKHVDLVSDAALGAVEVEGAMLAAPAGYGGMDSDMADVSYRKAEASDDFEHRGTRRSAGRYLRAADVDGAEVQEVGDFSVFESSSLVTIPAKRSTAIPVFQVEVADTKSVLHYKHENHPDRPYRSVDFTNHAGFSLGRGVCTVFEQTAYSGNCVVPALKPGESRLLPHALETGVSVHRHQKQQRDKVVALRLARGFCYTSTQQRLECQYHVKNNRDRTYELVLDHDYTLGEPDIKAHLIQDGSNELLEAADKLTEGIRYSIEVAPKSELIVEIMEHRVDQTHMKLVNTSKQHEYLHIDWLEHNLVKTNGPLALDDGIQDCLKIQRELEAVRQAVTDAVNETERLASRQERLRKNIKSGGQDELTSRWRAELDEAEQAIRKIEEESVPELRSEEKFLHSKLKDALNSLFAEWEES